VGRCPVLISKWGIGSKRINNSSRRPWLTFNLQTMVCNLLLREIRMEVQFPVRRGQVNILWLHHQTLVAINNSSRQDNPLRPPPPNNCRFTLIAHPLNTPHPVTSRYSIGAVNNMDSNFLSPWWYSMVIICLLFARLRFCLFSVILCVLLIRFPRSFALFICYANLARVYIAKGTFVSIHNTLTRMR